MFNSTTNKTTINNPATGIIQKSNEKSFFINIGHRSGYADKIFCDNPKYLDQNVSVLQILLSNNDYIFLELVFAEDL